MESALENNVAILNEQKPDTPSFNYLSSFAAFILEHHLEMFTDRQLQTLKETKSPLVRITEIFPADIVRKQMLQNVTEFLTAVANNDVVIRIQQQIERWLSDGFPFVAKDDVQLADVTAFFYTRKKCFMHFLPLYNAGKNDIYNIIEELDEFIKFGTSIANKTYIQLLNERITEKQNELIDAQNIIRQSIEQLKYSDSLYKESQKLSQIGSWVWNNVTNEVVWTEELYRIYNQQDTEQPTSESLINPCHPEDKNLLINYINNTVETGIQQDFNYRIVVKDGIKTLHARTECIKDDNGNMKILGMVQDISETIRIEQELHHKNEQLRQSNKSLEEFAYIASHDLREPLRKISAFGGMLSNALEDRATLTERMYIKKMVESSMRMQTMIDDLLSLSRISNDLPLEQYSLQSIFEEAIQNLELKIEEKNAVITTDKLPVANINPVQFRQLFQNLISNSLKFTRKDVIPEIKITHHKLTALEKEQMNLKRGEKYLKIQFKDNGIGFNNEYAEKIFQMFQRLHGRSEYEGTGIGLALCKRITEAHKGRIYAMGVPGEGAEFTIVIPDSIRTSA